jgi:phospholipase/carboxylesterase
MQLDESAILWSAPERERAGRPLLVLLHGYGSHEGDLFGMSPGLPLGPVIASLRAPLSEGGGWAWFRPNFEKPVDPPEAELDEAARAVLDWLDTQQHTSVGLLGFSQGGAIALQLLRLDPTRFAATVTLSGFVGLGEHRGDPELSRVRPPVFWGRGTDDSVIPSALIERTDAWISDHTDPTVRIYEGLAHSISNAELTEFSSYLRDRL